MMKSEQVEKILPVDPAERANKLASEHAIYTIVQLKKISIYNNNINMVVLATKGQQMQVCSLRLQHHDSMTYLYYRVITKTKADMVLLPEKTK